MPPGKIAPAERYYPAPDTAIVSCYFNFSGYRSAAKNLIAFLSSLEESHLEWLLVECAFEDAGFLLPSSRRIVHIRSRDVMWQKERLLNLAVASLSERYSKVVWLDCDVLFENPKWLVQTSELLDSVPIVQPFTQAIWLRPEPSDLRSSGEETWSSFAAVYTKYPNAALLGRYDWHGHTGFAWAARRDTVARHGLYDACLGGSGDHLMAHAFVGDWSSACLTYSLGCDTPFFRHFVDWSERIYPEVRAQVQFVPGTLLHLWHGTIANRHYASRHLKLIQLGFDPRHDIRIGPSGCWEWNSAKTELHQHAREYFLLRKEDG